MKLKFVTVMLFLSFMPISANAQDVCPTCIKQEQPQIVISRTEKIEVAPDIAEIQLQIWVEEVRVERAADRLRERIQSVFNVTTAENISKEDVKTLHYQVEPVYSGKSIFSPTEKPKTYTASQGIQITIRNLESIGPILAKISEIQDINIQETTFTSSKIEEYKREALKKAAAEARKTAEELASVAGTSLGRVLKIQESSHFVPQRGQNNNGRMLSKAVSYNSEPMPVSGGKLTVEASCTIVYELK